MFAMSLKNGACRDENEWGALRSWYVSEFERSFPGTIEKKQTKNLLHRAWLVQIVLEIDVIELVLVSRGVHLLKKQPTDQRWVE